ncbi:metal ABC transporter substrate-binding protein [Pseudomonas daroniae]|uniref:Metal ABC transporter substrate-binding protein n=1 Tax=Phytopseudomonas daroniae TaxID=2487519 RepID=A0A4Q9QPG0_9GAMM|nr:MULTISPECIES: zinc ABC transporter substrate-binding protein [Pseudomonas]TBU82113.1 metal ABC transporter substrate-binding protein [Pseudomonas daroniae]TBU84551.1 metal ABC transporter substrate-binding protein [Pseudomonas sp. FRB 228]TBU92414.1 metal ABC transporter substrate-binding protein [Pseudomonas daroniae]
MTHRLHHLGLALLLSLPGLALAKDVSVLVSQPITFGLASDLLEGTPVRIERAAPANLPASRQVSYFAGRGASTLHKVAADADAAIALRSLWPEDPLYPMARRSNIRIVEIDAARPVDGALPGIATQAESAGENDLASYPWLAINNMGRMADVMAADLVRLAPDAKGKVEQNLATLKQRLLKLNARSEAELAKADNLSVYSLSNRLDYLVSGLNLDLVSSDSRDDRDWDTESLNALTTALKEDDVALVLHHRKPSQPVADAVKAAGIALLVLETENDDPLAELEGNVDSLVKALTH